LGTVEYTVTKYNNEKLKAFWVSYDWFFLVILLKRDYQQAHQSKNRATVEWEVEAKSLVLIPCSNVEKSNRGNSLFSNHKLQRN
jgi:hypothetical protein